MYGGTKGGNLTQLKQTFSCSKEVAAQGGKLIHVLVLKLIKKVNRLEIKLKIISKHCHSMSLGWCILKGVPSAESSRSVRGMRKGVNGKPYSRLCNARRPRLEPGTFRSQAVRLYRLHQARPSCIADGHTHKKYFLILYHY